MDKKGFTLVELLAVVLILGVIIAIGATAITSTQKKIVEKQYENVINNILIKAEDYAHKNSFTKDIDITVQDLIDKGILVPGDDGTITNPIDNSNMNCYTITVKYIRAGQDNEVTNLNPYEPSVSTYEASVSSNTPC